MHELGVAFEVIKTLDSYAKENNIEKVYETTLRIGEVSGIINSYFEDVWKWACEKSEHLKGCRLQIETIKAVTLCDDCLKNYETVKYGRVCPHCGSEKTHLVTGNEMEIKEIKVE